jgi:hypothetical protein
VILADRGVKLDVRDYGKTDNRFEAAALCGASRLR